MQEISVTELKQRMDNGEQLNIIDVREPDEYAEFNIGGKLVPLGKIMSMQADELDELKDEELIVHCKAGHRSVQACLFLDAMGFSNTKNLTGGMMAWKEMEAAK